MGYRDQEKVLKHPPFFSLKTIAKHVGKRKTKQLEPEELVSILAQHESKQTDVIDGKSKH